MKNLKLLFQGFPEVHNVPDIPAELDAVTAHQTDLQFKEIMRKKKGKRKKINQFSQTMCFIKYILNAAFFK